jgi:tRNA pseudouridine38-40 synthase
VLNPLALSALRSLWRSRVYRRVLRKKSLGMDTRYYKITVAYDGTAYEGWQIQPNGRSIANVMQDSFFRAFKSSIKLIGASRTDAGVHALGQVASFSTDVSVSPECLLTIWHNSLPGDIEITSLEQTTSLYNPRECVVQKIYWYHLFTDRPSPFISRYGYFLKFSIDLDVLAEALTIFVGTHDFRSFCTGFEHESTIRTIDAITLDYNEAWQAHRISIYGKSFLRYMIRRIIGASLQVAMGQKPLELLHKALENPNPEQVLFNAPPHGLLLYSIHYKEGL